MLTVGLLVELTAKPGREGELENLLRAARDLAAAETQTAVWFAMRIDQTRYAIFDAFRDNTGRDAHLNGPIAVALAEHAESLLVTAPVISKVDVLTHLAR